MGIIRGDTRWPMLDTDGYIGERVLRLGDDGGLVAIATDPATPAGDLAALILNAGVIHRVGPHRLHVRLARALATRGIPAVRLDLSGIGDSRPLPDAIDFRRSAVADARCAMDHLEATGAARRFVLFGVCSGADNAIATAAADPRVAGLLAVDPPTWATPQSRRRLLRERLRRDGIGALLAGLARALARRLRPRGDGGRAAEAAPPGGALPPRAALGATLAAIAARGAAMRMVFTAVNGVRYNHPEHWFEVFPALRGQAQLRWFPHANHTFTALDQQAALVDDALDFCSALAAASGADRVER